MSYDLLIIVSNYYDFNGWLLIVVVTKELLLITNDYNELQLLANDYYEFLLITMYS